MKYNGGLENSTKILSTTIYIREEFADESIQECLGMWCNINYIFKKFNFFFVYFKSFYILISKIILKNKKILF